jgi:hypothetical protein
MMCAWLDVSPAHRCEFRDFHDREHLFERLSVPGFRLGRRFRAIEAPSHFLIVYELDSLETLASEDYLARLNAPTDWTRRCLGLIIKARRASARIDYSCGRARGGFALTVRLEAFHSVLWNQSVQLVSDQALLQRGVVSVRVGTADELTSNLETVERRTGTWVRQQTEQILLVESTNPECLLRLIERELGREQLAQLGAKRVETGIYSLEISVSPSV